jgi:hypothetical protein
MSLEVDVYTNKAVSGPGRLVARTKKYSFRNQMRLLWKKSETSILGIVKSIGYEARNVVLEAFYENDK